jgi:putative glutamine amidotransferase
VLGAKRVEVNSLHHQAVREIAPALKLEGWAPDGTVEALSWPDAPGFLVAVQWHPEYLATGDEVSAKLFQAFAEAARARAQLRQNAAGLRAVS